MGLVWAIVVVGAGYAAYAGFAWLWYGRARRPKASEADEVLDGVMPTYDVAERHHIQVAAPADATFAAACEQDFLQSPVIRAVFKGRELILGSEPDATARPRGLLAWAKSLGWGVLAEVPGREVVMGAVTQPWKANVVFRALPPAEFLAFDEPRHVKIAWTLRADPTSADASTFRTETRVSTTDGTARARFRRYWSLFSPGIILIRWASLRPLRAEAERRARRG